MIADLLQKAEVGSHLEAWLQTVGAARQALEAVDPQLLAAIRKLDPKMVMAIVRDGLNVEDLKLLEEYLKEARQGLTEEEKGAFIPTSPELSIVQSFMESAYESAGLVENSSAAEETVSLPGVTGRTLSASARPGGSLELFATPFDDPNPRYFSEGIKAVLYRKLHGAHAFSKSPTTTKLADRARLVLVGDWGTGIERADVIRDLMRKSLDETPDRERHVIHLGDIYFCGWPEESQKRFLDHWPVRPGETDIASWCLSGNHDMYCGGYGFYDVVLADARFARQGGCSYFKLENDHWQILGLDTSYDEWRLAEGQAAWAEAQRASAPGKKGLLLTHHQPHSAYEPSKSAVLAQEAAALLRQKQLTAWIWGHEHRAVAYGPVPFWFADKTTGELPFGLCLGHGGVPAHPTVKQGDHVLWALEKVFKTQLEQFGLFGYAVLDLDGASAKLTLIDETGAVNYTKDL